MSEETPRRLGRGLAALMGEIPVQTLIAPDSAVLQDNVHSGVKTVPIEHISRNPNNPRRHFDENALDELAQSIAEKGLISPILVRPSHQAGRYEIVAGERRWRAVQKAGLTEIAVIVRQLDDREALEIALIENVQRHDLNPIDEAEGYQRLIDEFGYVQNDLAQAISKSRSHVTNMLRLMKLPVRVQNLLKEGKLSMGHARALIGHKQAEKLAVMIVEKGLSVRAVEQLVKASHEDRGEKSGEGHKLMIKDADIMAFERKLAQHLGLGVSLKPKNAEQGELVLRYGSLDQLDHIRKLLGCE